jgi:hypothetical protein
VFPVDLHVVGGRGSVLLGHGASVAPGAG